MPGRLPRHSPRARVFNVSGLDPAFLAREQIGQAQACVFAMRDDTKNHTPPRSRGFTGWRSRLQSFTTPFPGRSTSTPGSTPGRSPPGDRRGNRPLRARPADAAGCDVENDRFEVLDITTSPTSEYVGLRFREMPIRGALIGAIVRDGQAVFPRSDDVLQAGDRVIVFTESERGGRRARPLMTRGRR